MSELRVYIRHARAASIDGKPVTCAPGIRAWCTLHGIDLRRFGREGLPLSQFAAIDDAFAQRMVTLARKEAERGQE